MALIKGPRERLAALQLENEQLQVQLAREREKVQFLGLLAADVDIDELMDPEEEVTGDGEE